MWAELDTNQKEEFKRYCDKRFGETYVFCETGEPMYIDKEGHMIETKVIAELLFQTTKN